MNEPTESNRERARNQPYDPDYTDPGRKPAEARPNAFNALAWLLEGATGLLEEVRHSDLGLSEKFWTHAYAARRETLLALRAALDELIERSEGPARQQKEADQRRTRRGTIDIEA
jgi:hypothetical protein